jgi:probable HAF family extracellular repeat protein
LNAIHQKRGESPLRIFSFFSRTACYLALSSLCGSAVQAASPEEAPYSITDLTLWKLGGTESTGVSLNNSGQVVGWWLDGGSDRRRRAFLHTAGQTWDIGTLGGTESSASDISDAGVVVGYSHLPDNERRAFRYANRTMEDLGTLGGQESIATAVNAAGVVVGYAKNSADEVRGFRTTEAGMQDIGQLATKIGFNIYPASVNNAGQVVGTAPNNENLLHAFFYADRTMHDLGTLGGGTSFATRINQRGDVTGYAETAMGEEHAFYYSRRKGMRDIGTLGGRVSRAYGLNNRRQVVGYSVDAQNTAQLAFAYEANAGMKDLNSFLPEDSGWILRSANGINDRGQITGWGSIGGEGHAFLMTPNFPKTLILDSFGRSGGNLGRYWSGDTQSDAYSVEKGRVRVGTGGAIYWKRAIFGSDQEAFIRFERISRWSTQGLALKVPVFGHGTPDARNGGIVILYDARRKFAQMGTILPRGRGWRIYRPIRVEFQDGDQFGARVYATGEVRIYKNHWPIETIPLAPEDTDFFGSRGGAVGIVSFPAAGQTAFSEFGGGNVPD